jgi:hypothetical protein
MGNVVSFDTTEPSAIDTDPIQRLKRELGEKRCRALVDGMIFEVTDALCKIERMIAQKEFEAATNLLDKVADISGQLGLVCLTDVAMDLKGCVEAEDWVSVAAVSGRLIRLGEDSLFSLIEFTNKSII